ncbi:FecCD family ABC transporter permease [Catellatospora coxensis]|uniref:Iron ABC transporter permease n=1 Tax=Catellatospora coxensis TaxID=310354 RepID=A0A8J3L6Z1_9ACTN|nr:iron chelate uptake ABC transporter family permease subunit [Catellatospora coxensis]GIG09055.1 iron ABC transporter permease [Catellatospora coxensis]
MTPAPPPAAAPRRAAAYLPAAALLLAVLCLLSLAFGSRAVPIGQVADALLDRTAVDPQVAAIVWNVRLPRTAAGLLVGAALGLAGALMQGLTRNPLADPGLLGVSAGASFAIVLAVAAFGASTAPTNLIWYAFAGALAGALAVHLLGGLGRGGATPVKTALAGIAVTFLLGSFTSALVLRSPLALDRFRFWAAGSLTAADAATLWQVTPLLAAAAGLALATAPALNSLALGEDVAAALGRRVGLIRLRATLAITVLAGTAVALAGPIVFVGLVTPHLARMVTGPDHRRILALTLLGAPCLLIAADVLGRVVARPEEIQAGIVVAFLGGPFFIALARRRRLAEM